jgi:hypothetical protein
MFYFVKVFFKYANEAHLFLAQKDVNSPCPKEWKKKYTSCKQIINMTYKQVSTIFNPLFDSK